MSGWNAEKMKLFMRRDIGIVLSIVFFICFYAVARMVRDGFEAVVFSSVQRMFFGLAELGVMVKLFHKESWREIIHFRNFKDGVLAGSGLLVCTALIAVSNAAAIISLGNASAATWFWYLICLQAATGFWEELNFRALMLEGYFRREKKSRGCRLAYAGVSFLLFGLLHALECDSIASAISRLILTGIIGFVLASVYLYSHNILVPMLLHFVYDIAVNFQQFAAVWDLENPVYHVLNFYVLPVSFTGMFIAAIVIVLKSDSGDG